VALASSFDGLMNFYYTICAVFCIPAAIGLLAVWRFKGQLWVATLGLAALSVLPGAYILVVVSQGARGDSLFLLPPLTPVILGGLLFFLSRPKR